MQAAAEGQLSIRAKLVHLVTVRAKSVSESQSVALGVDFRSSKPGERMSTPVQTEAQREAVSVHAKPDDGKRPITALAAPLPLRDTATIVIIDPRALNRECLARCLGAASAQEVLSFSSVEDWLEASGTVSASVIVLGIIGDPRDPDARQQLAQLMQPPDHPPVIVMSDAEDPDQIIETLHVGVQGYIPTSMPLDVAIESMRLVRAGGVFAPAGSLIASRRPKDHPRSGRLCPDGMFTARQAAVVEALRRGKANKIIAFELHMSESTVKVHIRNIMKKLRARNRTEVAFMTNTLFRGESL